MPKKGKGISLPATLPPGRSKSKDIAKKPTKVMKKPSMRSMKKK